ncbi:espin-like [Sesamum indicum]|uniref:Espin-like n=1 Tax=Sesamum indicum TaxID=4182 RepID=A0A6I9U2Q1_SESIN|nr:espin-like [Sesamum indicum]
MRAVNQASGPSGLDWDGASRRPLGLVHAFFYHFCSAISSCFYVFCCCWLLEDCLVGRRSFPSPAFGFGSPEPPPPPPPHIGPPPHGLLGSSYGPPGYPGDRGPF